MKMKLQLLAVTLLGVIGALVGGGEGWGPF